MGTDKKSVKDLPLPAQVGLASIAVIEVTAKIAALVDIARRPATNIRGPKWAWAMAQLLNGIGPVAYWSVGRK